jgi:hypothetical protein
LPKYTIDLVDVGLTAPTPGPFRSLHLSAEGDTFIELLGNAHIVEIDQDGGEGKSYPLADTGDIELLRRCLAVITATLKGRG